MSWQTTISNLMKMAECFPNREKTLGKGEIVHYEQFLLFPQCLQKACFPGVSKGVIVWEWVKGKDILIYILQNPSYDQYPLSGLEMSGLRQVRLLVTK